MKIINIIIIIVLLMFASSIKTVYMTDYNIHYIYICMYVCVFELY